MLAYTKYYNKIRYFDSRDTTLIVCHVVLQYHKNKVPCDPMGWNLSREVTIPSSLVAIDTKVLET